MIGALRLPAVILLAALLWPACGGGDGDAGDAGDGAAEGTLEGTFGIDAGVCDDEGVTEGSSFRMVQSGGTVDDGPYVINGDSPCGDKTWTPLSAGSDGGLTTGAYQPHPEPAFADGHGTAGAITEPQPWFAVNFSVATNETDPQTGERTSVPRIVADGGTLTGDLSAWAAAWNDEHFNQGAPKPGGATSDQTTDPTGTYDAASGAYSIEWSSQIVGGPFNNFTGVWRLEGTFTES